jgi:hypothetical protein
MTRFAFDAPGCIDSACGDRCIMCPRTPLAACAHQATAKAA